MRWFWFALGLLSVALGVVGIVLPLLPTVPFMILAAFCFARSSERMHNWLMQHERFGPAIADWQTNGAISLTAKRYATLSIVVVFMISVVIGLRTQLLVIQAITLGCVLTFIWSRPSGPR